MNNANSTHDGPSTRTTGKVIIISSVMFVFISYWRVAAVVLCDLASTAFYIGGIVEHSIGPAAPWFIVGVMLFSYAVRSVYIESCSMFVRGGVYRIVKEALGRTTAKIAVAALLFDYVLTGPISGVSAGQYLMSLFFELMTHYSGFTITPEERDFGKAVGSVVIACAITVYFFRLNVVGIHESSDKAMKIMIITTIMGVTILGWSLLTLAVKGPQNPITFQPTFTPKENPSTGKMESPMGFLEGTQFTEDLINHTSGRTASGPDASTEKVDEAPRTKNTNWLSLLGAIGFFIAFGHSVLAMSGEETLAQIYREVESPKLENFKKAAFIVFIYSLVLTGGISVLAVLLIPDAVRMDRYGDNLIGGLAMSVYGPPFARLLLNAFVVCVGSLILAGAVNTAIIGSNGVLNRVAEDGVIPDWFVKPHPRFGTTHRLLYLILGLQLFTIIVSQGDVLLLGEAYAFGVVWSFVFNCLAMLVLRFKEPDRPRGFKVPLNIKVGNVELPIGLGLIFVILLISAITNALTKEIATIAGACFTVALFLLFVGTEYYRKQETGGDAAEHLDEFNELATDSVTPQTLNLKHPYRKLVALRSTAHLDPLDRVLEEFDPNTTDVVTMTVNVRPGGGVYSEPVHVGVYDQELLNAIEKKAETAGKTIIPIIVSTNDTLHAVMQTVQAIGAQELYLGVSEKFTPNEQFDRCAHHWDQLHHGEAAPLTIRIVGLNRNFVADLHGGNRIPKSAKQFSKSSDQIRAIANVVDRVLFLHDGSQLSSDLFRLLMTTLDRSVGIIAIEMNDTKDASFTARVQDAKNSGRSTKTVELSRNGDREGQMLKLIRQEGVDIVISNVSLALLAGDETKKITSWAERVLTETDCRVLFAAEPFENSGLGR